MEKLWITVGWGYHTYDTPIAIDELKDDFNSHHNTILKPMSF